jgi:hypothetical protein
VRFDSLSSVAFTSPLLPSAQALAVGAKLDVTLRFRPDTPGATSGALLIPTADSPDAFVLLKGTGADVPVCRLDSAQSTVDFGQVVRGQSAQRTLTLANRGSLDCHLSSVSITGGSAYFTVTDPLAGPVALRPGDVLTFTLQYNPPGSDTNASDSGTATASSDDPLRPKIDVQLLGNAAAAPTCKLQITPASGGFFSGRTLQFGNVTVGKKKSLPVTLKNTGSANCQLQSYSFTTTNLGSSCGQKSCQGFSIIAPLPSGVIAPGQQTQVNVQFSPQDTNQIPFLPTVYLDVQTSDQAIQPECTSAFPPNGNNGCVQVGMAGQGVISNLAVIPSDLDFGVVTLGCSSRTQTVTIYNTGTASFTIKSFKVDGPNLGSFSLVAPPTPFSIAGGGKQAIQVTYKPSQAAPETATLYIESDASNTTSNNPYVTVGLSGSGTTDKHQKDTFTQLAKPTVDLLVIMDNSGSFDQYQAKLAAQAQNFINQALTYQADYHLGVTTNEADHTDTADSNASYPNTQIYVGGLYGQPGVLANDTPDVVNAFAKNVRVGTCCSSDRESGLEAAWRALSAPATQNAPPQGSSGFLRDEARLVMLNVTDEEDQSNGTTDFYVDFFTSLKGQYNAGLVSFNTLGGGANGCDANGVQAPAMPRYVDVANRTGGQNFLLCSADWGQVATQLSLDAFKGRIQFPLSRPADPQTLSVTLNGATEANPADFTFDQPSNSVVFKAVPAPSSTIVAEYDALCF